MNSKLIEKLSNADAVASQESEVRAIIKEELRSYQNTFDYDGLGSLLVRKESKNPDAPTIMFAAHMDEVGFLVRNISEIGFLYLSPLGNVLDKAKENQLVRVTTFEGEKFEGIMNVTKTSSGDVEQVYVDLGFESLEEVEAIGIDVGNRVCFASNFRPIGNEGVFAGKAMDDRTGCFALIEAMKTLQNEELDVNVVAAFTSSEEVGTRGGKTSTQMVTPDMFFAVDVANHPELDRSFMNKRKIGHGPMIVHYDKTMVPNPAFVHQVKEVFNENKISYQKDMLKGGGTDAAQAHLINSGIPSLVIGIPLRYCHTPYSIMNIKDAENATNAIVAISRTCNKNWISQISKY